MRDESKAAGKRRHTRLTPFWLAVLLCGCGYVGEPVPPSLKIPVAVADLGVFERGANLIIHFTAPLATTDGIAVKTLRDIEVRIDPGDRRIETPRREPGPVEIETPASEWVNRDIQVRVRAQGPSGRYGAWSNIVRLKILPPLPTPQLKAESAPSGVRLSWNAAAGAEYRVFRVGPGDLKPVLTATVPGPDYVDSRAEFGKPYEYSIQGFLKSGDSEVQTVMSAPATITPMDTFPPAVPSGLSAIAGISSIDLSWNPDTEPDLRGYYVYRSADGQPFARLGDLVDAPSFSDRAIQSGHVYRYEVSAVDQRGNESRHSSPVEGTAP